MIALLTQFGPLLLAIVALALALFWLRPAMLQTANVAVEFGNLADRATRLRRGFAQLPPVPEPQPDAEPEIAELELQEPAELSPLQKLIASRFDWLRNFHKGLRVCAINTGLSVAELTTGAWPPDAIVDRLDHAQTEQDVREEDQKLARLSTEIVQVLLSKCDHDLDPHFADARQANVPLQEALDWLVNAANLKLYAPEIGEPVDKRLHISLGVGARAGEELRGTVASVRARGLIDTRNTVITRAEIREYD